MNQTTYLFTSPRLGFRPWVEQDLEQLATLNADPDVMAHFPSILSLAESKNLWQRLQDMYTDYGYTYYAVDVLGTGEFIGFIGLAYQDFESPYTPATDIGWRLKKSAWGKGYATEGAERCLKYGFESLNLDKIISICPLANQASVRVMEKIGMIREGAFIHPKLKGISRLEQCVCYQLTNMS